MSIEVGIDLVDNKRIESLMSEKFIERILSVEERQVFERITDHVRKVTYLAGRFAAKEAVFKALKNGDKTANYTDFSILNDEFGAPYIVSSRFSIFDTVKVSISHTDDYATAIVIIEKKG